MSELSQLKAVGMQFCKPVISRLKRDEPADPPAADEGPGEAILGEPRDA